MPTELHTSTTQAPRRSALDREIAMGLAATEYDKVTAVLSQLTEEQWRLPTDCPGWDVRSVAGHIVGMAQMAASIRETVRQQVAAGRRAKAEGGLLIDALTALQVEKTAALTEAELVEAMRRVGPKAAAARRRTPAFVRNRTMPGLQAVGDCQEAWTFGFLLDVILTRDPFMHRIDIAEATGVALPPTADHEGILVDDVVREWADRHSSAYVLDLTGAAGGHWERGDTSAAPHLTMDALQFCRVVSGRGTGEGLLTTIVSF
ncbi:MAG: maleylpyruvate isomerase family mycothiol-dependent enzyme [Actinomycetota bacterium]|nr:maleylpyruvate isomerase family mycothiol-dependent enzyme [Actinomycetota bacterium]